MRLTQADEASAGGERSISHRSDERATSGRFASHGVVILQDIAAVSVLRDIDLACSGRSPGDRFRGRPPGDRPQEPRALQPTPPADATSRRHQPPPPAYPTDPSSPPCHTRMLSSTLCRREPVRAAHVGRRVGGVISPARAPNGGGRRNRSDAVSEEDAGMVEAGGAAENTGAVKLRDRRRMPETRRPPERRRTPKV